MKSVEKNAESMIKVDTVLGTDTESSNFKLRIKLSTTDLEEKFSINLYAN